MMLLSGQQRAAQPADDRSCLRPGAAVAPWILVPLILAAAAAGPLAASAADQQDTLQKAMAPPDETAADAENTYTVFGEDQESYDSNIFRLPANVDVATLVGAGAARADHINTASLGADGQWSSGRQKVTVDLRADDNRFSRNSDLDNISGNDRVAWNWGFSNALSGQVGASYYRTLASFINSNVFSKNLLDSTAYYGTARYQVGPRWALYGGVLKSENTLTAPASKENDNSNKEVNFGTELATDLKNSIGLEYRYTDAVFPHAIDLDNRLLTGDYREDTGRIVVKRELTEKTSLDANFGYLKRDYTTPEIRSFSGDVWHVTVAWQGTEKTQVTFDAWRRLQAYLTAESEYFVSKGVSLTPTWSASEKISLSFLASYEPQDYAGSGLVSTAVPRRDTVTAEQAAVNYTPIRALIVNVSYRHEKRTSNEQPFVYDDKIASASITVQF